MLGSQEAAPPTRHDLHWGQQWEPTGQAGSGLGEWEGHRPLGGGERAVVSRWEGTAVRCQQLGRVHGGGAGGQGARGI